MPLKEEIQLALHGLPQEGRGLVPLRDLIAEVDVAELDAERALETVCRKGSLENCTILVEAGCDINHYTDRHRSSPLLAAVNGGHAEIVKYLLEQGADPNLGRTLFGAARNERGRGLESTKLLVKHGVDINATFAIFGKEKDQKSALDWAAGVPAIKEYLRSVGAKTAAQLAAEK